MRNAELLIRIRQRLENEQLTDDIALELIQTVSDRVCLRLGVDNIPSLFNSIIVDAVVKLYRRTYYEGISSEGDDGITTSFVNDILEEYNTEFEQYRLNQRANTGLVKFL